jgi:glycosyltransferase involved in cell wall biosynthesis
MHKIAVVHDYFTQFGGAERVAIALAKQFDAPLFTSVYQPDGTYAELGDMSVTTSYAQRVLQVTPSKNFKILAPLYPSAFRSLALSEFETIVVSSSGYAHHIRHPNAFVYCHTPPHFIYDLDRYTNSRIIRAAVRPFLPWLTASDQDAARHHRSYAANSLLIAARIEAIYGKTAPVIYPPLATAHLPPEPTPMPRAPKALVVGRLLSYKRFEIAIAACGALSLPLTIVGAGPDEGRLRSLAGPNVVFAGRLSDPDLREMFTNHSIVLCPGIEDFGFGPVEANYSGRPVVAASAGGALETVRPGVSGMLVQGTETTDWAAAIEAAVSTNWDPATLRAATEPFWTGSFATAISKWIKRE